MQRLKPLVHRGVEVLARRGSNPMCFVCALFPARLASTCSISHLSVNFAIKLMPAKLPSVTLSHNFCNWSNSHDRNFSCTNPFALRLGLLKIEICFSLRALHVCRNAGLLARRPCQNLHRSMAKICRPGRDDATGCRGCVIMRAMMALGPVNHAS